MNRIHRRDWLKTGAVTGCASALLSPITTGTEASGFKLDSFHFDHILGTSLDVWIASPDRAAFHRAEMAILDEFERLRRIFSPYDSRSELSRLNRASGPFAASPELLGVLQEYERWQVLTSGACNARVGAFLELWLTAEQTGRMPEPARLAAVAEAIDSPGWRIDDRSETVTRLSNHPLNLNAIAKGFAIARAAAVARDSLPPACSGLINLGGDMAAWGGTEWPVGIQNPFEPAENAPLLGSLRLRDRAIATSGGYQRYFTVDGTRRSHLIDPRTGRTAEGIASATVVAPDSITANVLATTLCVLGVEAGLNLIDLHRGVDCLLVTADGRIATSPGLLYATTLLADDEKKDEKKSKAEPWPENFRLSIALELPKIEGAKRYRRPYAAIWIEDANGKAVRSLSVWGNSPKYLKDLSDWWKLGKADKDLVKAVTRATRGPGKYEIEWDGKDDAGNTVGQGTYTVRIEVHREFGKHVRQSGKIECKDAASSLKLDKNEEINETVIGYEKKKKP